MRIEGLAAVLVLLCLSAAPTAADVNAPHRAKLFKSDFVTAYGECTAPNGVTFEGIPACSPPQRLDPVCGFGPKGSGKVILKVVEDKSDSPAERTLKITASLTGLDPTCEGEELDLWWHFRHSGENCSVSGPECTAVDIPLRCDGPPVEKGKWRCSTTYSALWSGLFGPGQFIRDGTSLSVVDVYVDRAGLRSFEPGLLLR